MAYPTSTPYRWATDPGTRVTPEVGRQQTGARLGESAPSLIANDLWGMLSDWVFYLPDVLPSEHRAAFERVSIRDAASFATEVGALVGSSGGVILSSLAGTDLSLTTVGGGDATVGGASVDVSLGAAGVFTVNAAGAGGSVTFGANIASFTANSSVSFLNVAGGIYSYPRLSTETGSAGAAAHYVADTAVTTPHNPGYGGWQRVTGPDDSDLVSGAQEWSLSGDSATRIYRAPLFRPSQVGGFAALVGSLTSGATRILHSLSLGTATIEVAVVVGAGTASESRTVLVSVNSASAYTTNRAFGSVPVDVASGAALEIRLVTVGATGTVGVRELTSVVTTNRATDEVCR